MSSQTKGQGGRDKMNEREEKGANERQRGNEGGLKEN